MRKLLRDKRFYVTLELIGLAILLGALAYALRDVWAEAAPLLRARRPRRRRDRDRDRRRLLPRLRARLDAHPRRLRDPGPVPLRAAGGDALDARQVHPRRRLDADRARRRAAALRRQGHAGRARVDPARGRALGARRRRRLRRRARDHRRRRRTAAAARRVRRAGRASCSTRPSSRPSRASCCGRSAPARSCRCRRGRRSSCSASTR